MANSRVIVLATAILSLLAGATALTDDLYQSVERLDPLANAWPRELLDTDPTPFRSRFGIQVHPTCFEQLEKDGVPRAKAVRSFNDVFKQAATDIVSCAGRYPELKPYLREWASQFRRAVVSCSHHDSTQAGYGAANYVSAAILRSLSSDETRGIDTGLPLSSLAHAHKAVLVIPHDVLLRLVSGNSNDTFPLEALIHEALHSTSANSATNHDDLEKIDPDSGPACGENSARDRISVITSLCTGAKLNSANAPAAVKLRERIAACGSANGCEDMFTAELASWHEEYFTPSRGLTKAAARKLCERVVKSSP